MFTRNLVPAVFGNYQALGAHYLGLQTQLTSLLHPSPLRPLTPLEYQRIEDTADAIRILEQVPGVEAFARRFSEERTSDSFLPALWRGGGDEGREAASVLLAGGGPARSPRVERPKDDVLQAAGVEGGGGPLVKVEVRSLADLPKVSQALKPQMRLQMEVLLESMGLLARYGDRLRDFERAIGEEPLTGKAPRLGRELCDALMQEEDIDQSFAHHPIAHIVAAGLTAHFKAIGDLLGHSIYRDLAMIYRCLQVGDEANLRRAEAMVLQNLRLNPFNPWLIQAGKVVAKKIVALNSLGFAPEKKVEYYENLAKERKILENWDLSKTKRLIHNYYRKVREGLSESAWSIWSAVEMVGEVLGPIIDLLSGGVPSTGNVRKWLYHFWKSSKEAKGVKQSLNAEERKIFLEISLMFEDHRGALALVEKESQFRIEWEALIRKEWGGRWEEEINLHAIPHLGPHIVERFEAISELADLVATGNVVALVGGPGTGKTILAAQLARRSLRPVFWYGFRPEPNVSLALNHMAHFLETVNPGSETGLLATVQDKKLSEKVPIVAAALKRNAAILILDDFYRVLEREEDRKAMEELIQKGIQGNALTDLLLIGREDHAWLAEMGAKLWYDQGLTPEEGKRLLKNMGISTEKITEEEYLQTYRRVDGLPQGLLLYGQFLMAQAFFHKGAPIGSPSRLLPASVETEGKDEDIRRLFSGVLEGLRRSEKILLTYLAMLREPLPIAALEGIIGTSRPQRIERDILALKKALLIEDRQPGVCELHESFKAFTHEILGPPPKHFYRRAASYYRRKASKPGDFLESAYHSFMAGDYDAAIRSLSGNAEDLFKRGYLARTEAFLDRFNETTPLKVDSYAALLFERATLATFKGDSDVALDQLRESLEILDVYEGKTDIRPLRADILNQMGMAYRMLSKFKEALESHQKALAVFETLEREGNAMAPPPKSMREHKRGIVRTLHRMGRLAMVRGDATMARKLYELSIANSESNGDQDGKARSLHSLGKLFEQEGRWEEARSYYKESFQIYNALHDPKGRAALLQSMGDMRYMQGEWDKSRRLYEGALKIFDQLGDRYGMATNLLSLGLLEWHHGSATEALVQLDRADVMYADLGLPEDAEERIRVRDMRASISSGALPPRP